MTPPGHPPAGDSAAWDERYGDAPIWSGNPNGALVAEVADLPPGRALDVGCGEGADAVWLARRGWAVTGLDVSGVALDRAARHAADAGVPITWEPTGLVEAALPAGSFDLVVALYPALRRTPGRDAEHALLAAVAPGGTLLVVHHALDHARHVDHADHADHGDHADNADEADNAGFDPDEYVMPAQVAAALDEGWVVQLDERRARERPTAGAGAHHADDLVLRARRR